MTEPSQRPGRQDDRTDRRIHRAWRALSIAFGLLAGVAFIRIALDGLSPLDGLILALIAIAAGAAVVHAAAVAERDDRRRLEIGSFARILSALSRSVSPDAIVDAIVEDLGQATGADHIVVVRRRPDARVLEARLVSARPGVPDSTTTLPIGDLDDPRPMVQGSGPVAGSAGLIAERISDRLRKVYGLTDPFGAPLVVEGEVVGAIVVSRRSAGEWSEESRQIVRAAAQETSASLARVYSQRATEARATTDALTGLPNRRYFDEFVALLARRRRAGDAVGILMVDIDKFKVLNDTHGHATGDQVLRAVAGAMVGAVREDDVPARFGGEEFIVLLRNPDPGVAVEVAERIRGAVRGLDLRQFGVRSVSVSVGVAVADAPGESIEGLIETADRALYRAKRAGRDRVVAA